MTSARLMGRLDQTHGCVRCGRETHDLRLLGHGSHCIEGFLLSGLEGFDLGRYLFICLLPERLYFYMARTSVHR